MVSKESTLPNNAGEESLTPGSGRRPGGGNGNPLQYSCLGNTTNRGPWLYPRGCKESDTTEATKHYSHELSRVAKFIETKSRMVVARGSQEEGNGELIFNAWCVWNDEKILEIDSGTPW